MDRPESFRTDLPPVRSAVIRGASTHQATATADRSGHLPTDVPLLPSGEDEASAGGEVPSEAKDPPPLVPQEKIEWVYAYGSLMWHPGFQPAEAVRAELSGYRRNFALWSMHYRGTPECPGLVLALEPAEGSTCTGMALRLPQRDRARIIAELRERELVSYAYREALVPIALDDGRNIEALTYVVRTDHPQYAVGLGLAEKAVIIARACGARGANVEYLENTVAHLASLGIRDPDLEALAREVRRLEAGNGLQSRA